MIDSIDILNEKGYNKYLCYIENSNKKQFIRYGMNANLGENQKDYFLIDSGLNVLNDIQWDFDNITKVVIYPIPNEKLNIKNGDFLTNSLESQRETNYTRGDSGKGIYFLRDIAFSKCANVDVSNIKHNLSEDTLSGSYLGFLRINTVADMQISDTQLYNRKYLLDGRSTYDLYIIGAVNMTCTNLVSNNNLDKNRWGIMGTNYCKDVIFQNCTLNRIDAHQGIYNLDIIDCIIEGKGIMVAGQGNLNVINSKITAETFITLRDDYGSTWNGNVNIDNCTYTYKGTYTPKLFNYNFAYDNDEKLHNFGYECKFPNVHINNLTIDNKYNEKSEYILIFPNYKSLSYEATELTKNYWPDEIVINGYNFINNSYENPYIRISLEKLDYLKDANVFISDMSLTTSKGENITQKSLDDNIKITEDILFKINKENGTSNNLTIKKDEKVLVQDKLIKEDFEQNYTENGKYNIIVNSLEDVFGYTGKLISTFEINKADNIGNEENNMDNEEDNDMDNEENNNTDNEQDNNNTEDEEENNLGIEEDNNIENEEDKNSSNEENNNEGNEQDNNIENNMQSSIPLPQTGENNNWIIGTITILGIIAIIILYKIKHTK